MEIKHATSADTGERKPDLSSIYSAAGSRSFNRQNFLQEDDNTTLLNKDRRFAFTRHSSFRQNPSQPSISIIPIETFKKPSFSRSLSNVSRENNHSHDHHLAFSQLTDSSNYPSEDGNSWKGDLVIEGSRGKTRFGGEGVFRRPDSFSSLIGGIFPAISSGSRPMKRLFALIVLNIAYSTLELLIGLFTGRVGLVSDAFHLTFGCGVLSFSLFAMVVARKKPDEVYTYGYKRLEVLSAFTNAAKTIFMMNIEIHSTISISLYLLQCVLNGQCCVSIQSFLTLTKV